MELFKKIRDNLMGAEYERDEEDYDYVEEYDDESENEQSGLFARSNRRDENEKKKTRREPTRILGFDTYEPSRGSQGSFKRASLDSKVVNMPGYSPTSAQEVVICQPETLEDARPVCEYLKNNVICVINLEKVERSVAQRIADFLSGACDALDGGIQRISHDIFVIAPVNVAITSQVREELKKNGLIMPWIQEAFR